MRGLASALGGLLFLVLAVAPVATGPPEFAMRDLPLPPTPESPDGDVGTATPATIAPGAAPGPGNGGEPAVLPPPSYTGDFRPIAEGTWSAYPTDTVAGCIEIRGAQDWAAFWEVHRGSSSPGPPPPVDFLREIVLVCLTAHLRTCCTPPPEFLALRTTGTQTDVAVQFSGAHGILHALSRSYSIVAIHRPPGDVMFHHAILSGPTIPEFPPVP